MWIIIKFVAKWIIPIGFVEMACQKNDKLFGRDTIPLAGGEHTYWRISEAKKPVKGAGILIRRS